MLEALSLNNINKALLPGSVPPGLIAVLSVPALDSQFLTEITSPLENFTNCLIIFVRFSVFRTNKPITSYYFIITSFIFCSNSFETIQPIDLCFSPCVEEG